ncbi:hypothetical protein F5Y18DRAFT_424451 [Xylariaceae sp. FL1019]|nr:hypothetical protein F5Y18DRAFT_424451 [Xylariaceae sp. FL1019]
MPSRNRILINEQAHDLNEHVRNFDKHIRHFAEAPHFQSFGSTNVDYEIEQADAAVRKEMIFTLCTWVAALLAVMLLDGGRCLDP